MEAGLRRLCDVIMKSNKVKEFHREITMTVLLAKLGSKNDCVLAGICVIIFYS